MRVGAVVVLLVGWARADTFAVVAGIESYAHPELSAVPYAAADARAVADTLTNPAVAGLPESQVELYLAEPEPAAERPPTRANLLLAVKRLGLLAGPDDALLVFFAGHGIETPEGQFLLTADSDPLLLEETGIGLDSLGRVLAEVRAGTVVLLIDACRNDPYASRGVGDNLLTEGLARGLRPALTLPSRGPRAVATLLACQVGERAWAWPEAGHGAFTRFLVDGLRGGAADADGNVALDYLATYVQRQVADWSAGRGYRQHPMYDNPDGADLILARPRPMATVTVTSEPPGAEVTVDGMAVGQTPCSAELDLGAEASAVVQVVVQRDGYFAAVETVEARRTETVAVSVRLRPMISPARPTNRPLGPGFLGAELKDVAQATEADRQAWPWLRSYESGALVVGVVPASPAESRLVPGMVVLSCDGERTATAESLRELIRAKRAGETVRLLVRDERPARPIEVILDPAPEAVGTQVE